MFKQKFRLWLLKTIVPLTKFVGNIHLPFTRKKVTGKDFVAISSLLRPGMVLLTKTYGEFSNVLIPGDWSHAGIYIGDGKIIEALGRGVSETDIASFVLSKDKICLLKPFFATDLQMEQAAFFAKSLKGLPYDYEFMSNNKAFYCSEIVYAAYHRAMGGMSPFELRETLGVNTAIPDDIFKASSKWQKLYISMES